MHTLVISYIYNLKSINISIFIIRSTPICHLQGHCNYSSVLVIMWNIIKALKIGVNSCGHMQTMGSYCFHSWVLWFLLAIPSEGNYVQGRCIHWRFTMFSFCLDQLQRTWKYFKAFLEITFYTTRWSGTGQHF